jgi:epoxide hydrolase-like predicted phosphatase
MEKQIKAVIFDMGGVILRTVDLGRREAMAKRLGTTRTELEKALFLSPTSLQSELGELSDVEHWQTILTLYHQPVENYPQMYAEFFSGDEIDLDLIAYIRSLKKDYKVGLLSNAWMNARQNIKELHDFMDIFDVSIFSAEVGLRKPDARIFQLMLDKLQVEAGEAVFVDDFPQNIAGAQGVGLHTVLFRDSESAVRDVNNILES